MKVRLGTGAYAVSAIRRQTEIVRGRERSGEVGRDQNKTEQCQIPVPTRVVLSRSMHTVCIHSLICTYAYYYYYAYTTSYES